jgi:Carbohydrate family 9 binding domain-like
MTLFRCARLATPALLVALLVALSLLGSACVEKSTSPTVDKGQIGTVVSKQRPTPKHPLDIRFADQVRLLGYDLDQTSVSPERPFTITWYWQVDKPLGPGWEIFTHGADVQGKTRLNLDSARVMRSVYGVPSWKAGDFVTDRQEITLPKGWGSDTLVLYLGFYLGAERLPITTGQRDGQQRAQAARIPVREHAETKPLARLVARRLGAPLALDGKLDDKEWQAAQPSGPLVNTMTGGKGSFPAEVRVAYDATHLYVGFEVEDDELISSHTQHDDHLWEQDCVEVMIDPDGDAKNYFELQVSPRGVSFETRYDSPRNPRPFGDVAWDSKLEAKVALHGTLDDDDGDDGYGVEAKIPWAAFAVGATPASPPKSGDSFRMNFFVMDARKNGQRAVGWSAPLVGDFHTLQRFGRVVFPVDATFRPPAVTAVP